MRCIIVDDEPLARTLLRALVADIADLECVGEADTGPTAIALIETLQPDVVFMDIELPELSGLDVVRQLKVPPAVVFTTAYDQFAVDAFELAAVDYLLKPFGLERLRGAVARVRSVITDRGDSPLHERVQEALALPPDARITRFFVRDRGKLLPVHAREVERLEADDDYVRVYSKGRVHLVYLSLNDFERRLDPERFLRVHRGHMVNLDFVQHLLPQDGGRLEVLMRDGTRLTASRARSRELRGLTL